MGVIKAINILHERIYSVLFLLHGLFGKVFTQKIYNFYPTVLEFI